MLIAVRKHWRELTAIFDSNDVLNVTKYSCTKTFTSRERAHHQRNIENLSEINNFNPVFKLKYGLFKVNYGLISQSALYLPRKLVCTFH